MLTPAGLALARSMLDVEWGSRAAVLDAMTFAALRFGTDDAGFVWIGLGQLADWIGAAERTTRTRVKALAELGVIQWLPGIGKRPSRLRPMAPTRWRVPWRGGCSAELAERRCVELGLFHVEPDPESLVERAPGSALYRHLGRAPGGALYGGKGAPLGARSTKSTDRAPRGALYGPRELAEPSGVNLSPSLEGPSSERASFDPSVRKAAGVLAHDIADKAMAVNGRSGVFGASFETLCHLVADYGPDVIGPARAWIAGHQAPTDGAPRWVQNLTRAMAARHTPAPTPEPQAPAASTPEERHRRQVEAHRAVLDPETFAELYPEANNHNGPPEVGAA